MLKKTLVVVLSLLQGILFAQSFNSKLFSNESGLPDLYVYSSFQDREGFLWSATTKGLVRFDGQVFHKYNARLPEGDFIYSGVDDEKGTLWFGTFAGKILKLNKKTDSLSFHSDTVVGSIDKIILSTDKSSLYFISKGNGIALLQNNKLAPLPFSQIYQVNSSIEIKAGHLLLATPEGLYLADVKQNKFKKIKGADFDIVQLQKINGQQRFLMLINGKGIVEARLDNLLESVSITELPLLSAFKDQGIACFNYNENNNLFYVATRNENLNVVNTFNNTIKTFGTKEYQAIANSIITDKDNNVWISTAGKGLYRFYKEEFDIINLDCPVFSITRDNAQNTYYGTDNGIEITNREGFHENRITKLNNKTLGKVTAIYFDGKNLWVGTENNGLHVINPANSEPVKIEFSAIENLAINSIAGVPNQNLVFVSTNLDGAYIYDSYKLKNHFSVQNSLLHNNVYYSLGCKNKNVYYATHNTAINFSKGDQVYEINLKSDNLVSDFNNFAESKDGLLAIGTDGDGVYFLKDTSITPMAANSKLDSKYCNALTYDKDGNLWIALRYNLYKYFPHNEQLKKIDLGLDNSVMFNINSIYTDKNGEIYFGTNKHVIKIKSGTDEGALPKSYIWQMKMFDTVVPMLPELQLKHRKYDITFEYSSLCLRNSEEIYFRYILEGRDNKWSEPTHSRKAEYFNLDEGEYTFKVMAYNGDGFTSNQVATYSFVIAKPFWKSIWFWLLIVILLATLVYFIVVARTAALVHAKARLEKIVDEKTHDLRLEKELVEAKNQIIEEQNKDITSSITYAKRIQEAILPDKNLSDAIKSQILIYYKPKDIVSGDFYWIAEKNNRFLFAACDCTGHGVPGAFMSMIGTTLLNKIVFDNDESNPDKIIQEMDIEVSKSLRQEDTEVNDGMEAGLCSIDMNSAEIMYSGAKRPLFYYRKSNTGDYVLEEYKADKYPIGGFSDIQDKIFTCTNINGTHGDMAYMFSDGVIDQFNSVNNKRFSTKQLRTLLEEAAKLPIQEQWQLIDRELTAWKGKNKQTDDILLIGIRL
ncbi:MAG: SpoIIE family protein phosphatase [Bacteroidia bacterium]|nr:SpoIIE family protein phosphatase [Bacteroidia bacterium]